MEHKERVGKMALKWWELVVVGMVLVLCVALGASWVLHNQFFPSEHSSRVIQESYRIWQVWRSGNIYEPSMYPPLAYLPSVIAYEFFGFSLQIVQLSLLIWLIPLLVSSWLIGRYCGGRIGGMIALGASAANPTVYYCLHNYFSELAVMAFVCLAFALYIYSDGGRRPVLALMLAIVLGLGILVKWSFALCAFPLAVACLLNPISNLRKRWLGIIGLIALCALSVFCLISGQLLRDWTFGWTYDNTPWGNYHILSGMAPDFGLNCDVAWEPFVLIAIIWWLAVGYGVYQSRRRGWEPFDTFTLCGASSFSLAGWWYYLGSNYLTSRIVSETGQGCDFSMICVPINNCIAGGWIWLVLALVFALWKRTAVLETILAIFAVLLPLWAFGYNGFPGVLRYLIPASAMVTTVGVAWIGSIRYLRTFACLWVAVLLLINTGAGVALGVAQNQRMSCIKGIEPKSLGIYCDDDECVALELDDLFDEVVTITKDEPNILVGFEGDLVDPDTLMYGYNVNGQCANVWRLGWDQDEKYSKSVVDKANYIFTFDSDIEKAISNLDYFNNYQIVYHDYFPEIGEFVLWRVADLTSENNKKYEHLGIK